MPRKRKSLSSSPKRRVSVSDSSFIPSPSSSLPLPSAMSNNRKDVFSSMCEMFPNLDSSLVEMVLSEYKEVEIVMDYLLELSTASKGNTEESTGFAEVASFLDDFQTESQGPEIFEDVPNQIEEQQDTSYMDETVCNDLDMLLDEALDQYGLYNVESFCSTEHGEDASLLHNIVKPELDQAASIDNTSFHMDHTNLMDQSKADLQREDYTRALDSDVTSFVEREAGTSSGVTEVANVQSDCKAVPDIMFSSLNCSHYGATYSQENVRSVEKPMAVHQQCAGPVSPSHVKLPSAPPKTQTKWNPMASSFYPISSVNPSFIAPVAVIPSQWTCRRDPVSGVYFNPPPPPPTYVRNNNHFPQTHWIAENTKPINKAHSGPQTSKKVTPFVGNVLVLLRGAPGSGKSTLARLLLEQNPSGVILSTDDYFSQNGEYQYDINCLGEAHEWNHKRAKDAFEKNVSPIIIDNTNIQGWEMKPYVSLAMKHKYQVTFRKPDTWWKYKPKELERRNRHGVKKEKIIKMLENFERVTVNSILNLGSPKSTRNADCFQIKKAENTGELNVLPRSLKEEETSLCKTPESGNMGNAAPAIQKSFEVSTDGSELFPDVTKSEGENYVDLIQLEQDINTENEGQCKENCSSDEASIEAAGDNEGPDIDSGSFLNERPELLSFVGDWPVEQTMSQRAPRSRKARARHERHNPVQKNGEDDKTADPGTEQIDTAITHEPIDNQSNEEDQMIEAAALEVGHCADISTVNDGKEGLLELENLLYTLLTKEDCAEEDGKSEDLFIDKISDVQEQVSECTDGVTTQSTSSVNEEVKIKPRTPRHNSRQCKLALNFPNNCATSSKREESECLQQPIIGPSKLSQTEPHDFAIAWRAERNEDVLGSAKIILGESSRFTSKSLDGSSDAQESIPYRVMHHKSTFVEEDDIISLDDQDSLVILCKLFRSLSFDVVKDLFERCNKDLVWTTNLLLDSGEKMYKDEECEMEDCKGLESCSHTNKDNLKDNNFVILEEESVIDSVEHCENEDRNFTDLNLKASEYSPFVNAFPLVVAEELKNGNVLSSNEINLGHQCTVSSEIQELFPSHETIIDTIASDLMWPSELEADHPNVHDSSLSILQSSNRLKTINKGKTEDIHLHNAKLDKKLDYVSEILAVGNYEEREFTEVAADVEEEKKMQNKSDCRSHSKESLQFDYLELTLPPEFAYQLTELFGPVAIDPGSLTFEDCVVPIDLKLAESIHQKWKESIMERQRQEALSYQLIFQDSLPDDPVDLLDNVSQKPESGVSQRDTDLFPFMDQWNTRVKKVSLRQIIAEEMALQAHEDSKKSSSSKNCAVKLKEKQLLELFPYVEQQLLLDIFKENDYSLEKTEQFMSSVLEADPVQNVIAQGFKQAVSTATETNKEKKLKPDKEILNERYFQDLDYPNYDDFRAEAFLYHQKQQESYRKAAEAHNRGMKQVATYYAQQGYLYGQKMKEEHRRAAVEIFESANEYLLPENILDLHGLHLDEAMKHFRKVLQEKTDEFKQNGGKPHLLVITGRGNHSQGGVPRIKPAVVDFLTNHDYRFQEKTPGVLRVTLK
ncbi:NEDD4-binding protein 2 [Bufo bufo]|uniref:NEDD4-binding protein 2 n=1 Tax=Bufo bufo TaxID=8384 RepID=UPI001ABEACED|nr:NEDD4-binding protein 2 [Bufo bufo]XP_040274888.1 NEDD4-binding protein 2 [Bufo bufo]XP_040274889.1 NEDD4-binding protein 2 [Bufo bufo]XP_040274890.1 NEDD4-binding protein 2 [Bufo bufo]